MLFLGSLLLSAFYSGSEAALVSLSVDRTKQLIEEGGSKGRALGYLLKYSNELLTTILVGNTLVNIFAATLITEITEKYFGHDVISVSVGFTTFVVLLFGEIIPKTISRRHAEALAVPCIWILMFNFYFLYPVTKLFTWIIRVILGKNAQVRGRIITKDDIEFMVSQAEQDKSMDSKQLDLLSSILEFPSIRVKDVMVPRQNVMAIPKGATFGDVVRVVRSSVHSRYPVYDGNLDNTIGFIHVKDLALVSSESKNNFTIENFIKKSFFVYESMRIQTVFDSMNRKKVHLAMVKDEMGVITGILSLEDIMEEIFGEIQDEHDEDELSKTKEATKIFNDGLVLRADVRLRDLDEEYDITLPLDEDYTTLTGFILDKLGHQLPKRGAIIIWENYYFELINVVENEIREVLIRDVKGERHFYSKREPVGPLSE